MNEWQIALVTLAVLCYLAFIICGTIIGIWLAKDNNKLGILISFFSLPIIGPIICLIIMQRKYKLFNKLVKKKKRTKPLEIK